MKAVVARGKGGPDVLELQEVPDPQPADDELLVRVEAAGINHIDLTWRAGGGIEFPAILGVDAAGRIEPTGERVLVTGTRGTYAELVAAKKDNVFPIPDELVGAKVYATTRREKLDKARELGAEPLEYGDSKLRDLKANVVFDPVGAETFADSVDALGREGVLVTPGAVGRALVSFNIWTLLGKRGRIQGIGAAQASRQTMDLLIGMAASGKIRPIIDRELPLGRAAEAHRAIGARETFGNVILRP